MNYFKNNKVLLLVIAALILVNLGLLYYGFLNRNKRVGGPRGSFNKDSMMARTERKLRNEVGFNDAQIKQYEALRTKHFDSLDIKLEELGKAKENFINLVYQPQLSDSSINAAAGKVCEKQRSIDEQMLRHFVSVRQLATEEQRPRMDSFLQKITKRMSGRGRMGPSKNGKN
jgi:Spy/CpxP family protein refolding chaperone